MLHFGKTYNKGVNMAIQKVDDISGGVPSGTKEKEKKKTGILEKYFTGEGIDSLPEDNWWRKLNEKVESSMPKDDGYTLGASLYTPESKQLEIGKNARDRISTEKITNGESSRGWALFKYTPTEEDLNNIGGIYVDKRTGKEADSTYVNEYYNTISNKIQSLNFDMSGNTRLYQTNYMSEDEYKNKYDEYIKAYDQTIEEAKELENYDYLTGKDYYEYLKANGTDQEIKDFEAYVGSYDDSVIESLTNAYKASLVDLAATPFKLGGMIQTFATRNSDNPYDYTNPNSITSKLEETKNEIESYCYNGKNGDGVRRYALQTIATVMPMVNDMVIAMITGGAMGLSGNGMKTFVNLAVDTQFGISSASETMRERMKEGCSIDTSFYNAVGHGLITAGIEALNVGNVTNIVNLFTGAGGNILGVGMLSTPKLLQVAKQMWESGKGEAFEEWAEVTVDCIWDNIFNWKSSEDVKVSKSPLSLATYGGIGDGGLTDQMIMAFGSAVILQTPTMINTASITIDSKKKYNASVEASKYWGAAQEYYTAQGDVENANKCLGVINLITEEQQKYVKDNKVSAAVYSETDAVPQAPSVQEVLNMTANAFRLDVNDAMEVAEQNKQKAVGIYETLENKLVNRGYLKLNNAKSDYSGISIDTYASLTPEGRLKAKEILDAANTIGADVKIDNTYRVGNDIISMEKTLGENENGITINGDTIVVNPYALDMQSIKGTDIIAATVAHEVTHTLEKTKSYADLEQAVIDSIGKEKYAELIDKYTKLYEGKQGYTPEKIKAEVIAKEIEHNFTNLGGMDFFQKIADYNDSAFTKIYSNMKALMSSNPNNEISNAFFKAYNEKLNAAMKSKKLTDVCGSFISRDDCQFNISQYKEKGRDDLVKFLNNSVKNKSLTQVEANDILTQLDYYSDMIDEMANNPDFAFNNFAQWSNVSMTVDHQGYPQLTCVVANGEYKMNIDFSTVCKKRLDTDAVLNQLAKEGILDAEALTEEQIASLRQIVKDNGLEVACALCFVDSKRYKQGGWADTLINGKIADKKDDKLISLGVMDAETKKVMGWNDFIAKITPEGVTASNFNFAERPEVNEGTLHTLSNNEIANYEWLKNVAANTSKKSEIGKIANALLNNPELRKTLDLGDLYASTAFKNIKKGNQEFFKIVNQHQGVAKPKSPYLAVTYNNEIIKGRGFTSEKAAAVGGVRIQSFSDYMANMVFDYMEMVAELSAKKLTAQSYTKVPDFAKLFGMTGIKINMSIIPKAITMSSQEFLKMSDSEKAKIKETAGLELFSNEEVKMMENPNYERFTSLPEETRKKYANYKEYAIAERGLSQTRDGSQYSAYIFEDESFDWMEALEIQMQTGYENNVGTICVGVSDEHIWKLLNDDNVKMVIPYHKSSLNKIVAEMMNIGAYNDYTDFQTTGVWDGTSWTSISNDANKKAKHKDFNFYTGNGAKYTGMIKNGYDARKTSESYLRYCADMGYRPKFDRFAYVERTNGDWVMNDNGSYSYVGENNGNLAINDNYYKVLIDFRAYDNAGNVAAQKNVKMSFPENMKELVKESLQQYENATNFRNEKFPSIVEQAKNFLAKEANIQASLSETNNKIQASLKEDYSDAVIKNDKEAAQEVLDKVASEKGYTKKMWNGSPTEFYVFDHNKSGSLFYLTDDRGIASRYAYGRINPDIDEANIGDYSDKVDIKQLYVRTENTLDLKNINMEKLQDVFSNAISYIEDLAPSITDKKEKMKLDESHNIALKMFKGNVEDFWWYSKSDSMFNQLKYLVEALKDQGYDSIYYRDDIHDTLAVFDANQLKSAEPFTYDNNGNLIPLENRFDETTDDIRYSISENNNSKTKDEAAEKAKLQQEFADSMSERTGEKISVNDINEMWLSATQRQSLKEKKKVAKMREAFKEWHAEIAEDASKWVKGYDTIRAKYPMFSKQTIDNFYADEITNGGCSGETYNQLADSLSLVIDYEGGNKTVSEMLNEFYQDTIELMEYEANYQYKDDDRKPLKNAIITNMAYDSKDIAGEYDKQLLGASLDEASQEFKQDIKDKYMSMVEQMLDHNRFQVENGKRKADSKISQWRTFDQNLDVFCRGNASLRETMNQRLRTELLDVAAQTRADIKANAQTEVIDKIKELGIVGGSKESAALQYFLEGHTEVKKDGVYIKFTEDSLNKNYSYKMANGKTAAENIKTAATIMRQAYDDAYFKITRTQLEANGDIEGKAKAEVEQKKAEVEMLARSVENIIAEIKRDGYKQETVSAYEVQQKKLNTAIKKYNALVSKEGNGDLTRRNLTPYRQNFSHHIFKSSIKNKMNSIINAEYQVPTELAGESDFTKPNTAWTTINLAQEGAPYIPDAVTSFAQYMSEAADVISFNPVITSLRQFASDIGSLATGTELGKFKNYIHDYANMLAGKRNDVDRWAQKAMGERGMAAVKVLNGYAKAAALAFNFRSGLVQFANIPNGMAILEQRGGKSYVSDVANGMKDYIKSLKTRSAIDQSPFISNRFFDFDTGEKSLPTTMKNIADGILTTGDKIGAELIWWGAYEQGNRLKVDNSILYADDVTRRAIAGRTKEDMSLGMQSQVINLLAPFQIENINLFQNIRDQAANKQTGALLTVSVGAFVFNMIIKHITGGDDEVLPEFITPIYEEIKKTLNGETDANEVVENIFWGEIAEFLSLIPFGNQVTQLVFGNDSESVFADYNPNRYGTTNIGLAGIGNMIIDMVKHKDDPTQQILDVIDNLVGGYVKGGKQLTRTIEGLQSMGALPKYVPSDSDEESPDLIAIKNTIANNVEISPINYSGSGKIAWVNDQSDIGDWIRATLFGKWSTKGARGYIDSGFKTLSTTASRVYETLSDAGVGDKVSTYKDAKTYQTNKSDKSGVSLKEQLTEEGKYDEYKKEVEKKYEEYLKNNTDEDVKTKAEFFNQYGISKSDLQEDTFNDFYKEYKVSKSDQVISQAMKIEDVVQNGETVKNGAAALRRQTYETAGIYDSLVQYIKDNNLLYTDFGLNKTVVEASDSELNKIINKTQGIEEDTTSSSSSTTRQKAIKKIASDYKSKSSAALDLLDNMTSVADAKKKAQATRK